MSTLREVAARAGVSISAVSRIIRDDPAARVSAATRQRILLAAAELNYQPNFTARALRSSRTKIIAFIVPDLTNALFTDLMRGVEDAALEHDYMVLLAHAEGMQPGGRVIAKLLGQSRVDGVLVHPGDDISEQELRTIIDSRVPAVLIHAERGRSIASVIVQDALGAQLATEHLLQLGHRRIALANGLERSDTAGRRRTGYLTALAEAHVPVDSQLETRLGYEPDAGARAFDVLMALAQPPTAIVVANLNAALGLVQRAGDRGISVPGSVSVVGIHDAWIAELSTPRLTTVALPLYELGRAGFTALHARIETGQVRQDVAGSTAPRLVVRASTAAIRP